MVGIGHYGLVLLASAQLSRLVAGLTEAVRGDRRGLVHTLRELSNQNNEVRKKQSSETTAKWMF